MNNETIGISAELAIADTFDVEVSPLYRDRGDEEVAESIRNIVYDIFEECNIPTPVEHIAENQSPIDFILENGKTLSVKTNQKSLEKLLRRLLVSQQVTHILISFAENSVMMLMLN